jgi:tungstate transport system ATP-binding protein
MIANSPKCYNSVNYPVLRVENLRKYYGDRLALEIPHLEFEAGEIYALVGPNGAGKTTLLKLLDLLERPTEGKLYFDGLEINGSSSDILNVRRQMTLVMQNSILFHTSVYRNVVYGLSVRSYDRKAKMEAVSAALDMVGLSGFEHRKARQLSAGESQRVALARALVLKPRVLFLDEPTANVDRRNIQVFEALIKKANAEQDMTIILTTHDLLQAYRLTDNIISLLDGRMIGSSPENIFYGQFEGREGQSGSVTIHPSLRISVADYKPGSAGIYIDPRDITVSSDPVQCEHWNCLAGHITSITSESNIIRLTVNVGVEIAAIVKNDHFQRIPSDIFNRRVYVAFKASDVRIF